ncbi:MAG: peptidylprolyl isomerase [Clostridiales bacterium]|nr:peptidylprolyl isomerase [Clostridiales bacterium]
MANQKQAAKAAARQAAQEKQQQRQKTIITVAGIALLAVVLAVGGIILLGGGKQAPAPAPTSAPVDIAATDWVQIDVQDYGAIVAELYRGVAPITVENFINLVNEGFYDGLTFHRVISGFMIQGGDPKGNGTGGSDRQIKGEFAKNGVDNPIAHERGVLSMARANPYDSASSQFFIMHQAAPHLDGGYAAFGRVLTGMEVVDAICQSTPVTDGNGTVAKANQPIITSIRVIDKPTQ